MVDYANLSQTALQLIQSNGSDCTIKRVINSTFNPSTNAYTAGTTLEYAGYGVLTKFNKREIDGTEIKVKDKLLLLAAANLIIEPEENDTFEDDEGNIWQIIDVEVVKPADIPLLYRLQLRK